MSLTKQDLQSIGDLLDQKMDQKFVVFEKKINKNTDKKIEDLARLTAESFYEVNSKFNEVNSKFDEVNSKFDEVDKKILESEERVKGIIKGEVDSLENKINSNHTAMVSELIKVYSKIDDLSIEVRQDRRRTMEDDRVLFIDVDNIKKDMSLFRRYFKKIGMEIPQRKGAR